jgi:acetyl esterase
VTGGEAGPVWPRAGAMSRAASVARLDPELAVFGTFEPMDLTALPIEQARVLAQARAAWMLEAPDVVPECVAAPGLPGEPDVAVRVHRPPERRAPQMAILHIHGGGMVMGSAEGSDAQCCKLAARLSALVVSVDYRLAPETSFPGALLDCVAAWMWLVDHAALHDIDPKSCVVTGDSAGGGIAAALCLYLRDAELARPAGQVLVFPMLDHRTGAGLETDDTRVGWNSRNNQFGWASLLGNQPLPEGLALGHYSPARAADLSGLPPCWIGVGALDLFLEENVAYAGRIALAGGEVNLLSVPGAPHSFQTVPSRPGRDFNRAYLAALRRFAHAG